MFAKETLFSQIDFVIVMFSYVHGGIFKLGLQIILRFVFVRSCKLFLGHVFARLRYIRMHACNETGIFKTRLRHVFRLARYVFLQNRITDTVFGLFRIHILSGNVFKTFCDIRMHVRNGSGIS